MDDPREVRTRRRGGGLAAEARACCAMTVEFGIEYPERSNANSASSEPQELSLGRERDARARGGQTRR
jgi:hypothetical protein